MRILTIIGPTAAGKTELAITIATSVSGEIISADSRQIYRHLNIGTAKPTQRERKIIPFHLIDFIDPASTYSCGQFARDAEHTIDQLLARHKIPIVCGGTGLYIRALYNPLHQLPASSKKCKEKHSNTLKQYGVDYLYRKLRSVDPEWADRITPKDKQRILRGLEVFELTGKPLSALIKEKKRVPKYRPYYIGLNIPREELYSKINKRYDIMIEQGLVKEVRDLLTRGYNPGSNALRTIGYKEIIEYLKGRTSFNEAIHKAKQRTRNFAKRQLTWFKRLPDVQWFSPQDKKLIEVLTEMYR